MKDDAKRRSQERFGNYAEGYVHSATHAAGHDLNMLLEMAAPAADWRMLDVATGGGHTALKFAPHVKHVIASDLTPRMLKAARTFITERGAANITFTASDAENLAFPANTFDLVTCRIAPHHFPDAFHFVTECARVLKPGGVLLVEDHVMPEDDRAARYIDSFERLRDPSHHRAFAEYEWRGMFLDAGLTVDQVRQYVQHDRLLIPWAELQGNAPEVIERLGIMLAQAPAAVAEHMQPGHTGTSAATFSHRYILILGRKS